LSAGNSVHLAAPWREKDHLLKTLDAVKVHWTASFGFGLCFSIVATLGLVYQVKTVGLNPLQMVLVGTTLETTVFLFEVPTGVVADAYSRRLSIIIGFFVVGVGFLIEGSFPVFAAVLLAQVVWGFGWTFISGARSAWIADEVGPNKVAPVYLRATQFHQLGTVLGIPISVALGSLRLNLPILVGGGVSILIGIFLALFMPEQSFKPAPSEEHETWQAMAQTLRDGLGLVRKRPVLRMFLVIGAFIGLSSEGYDRLWTPHILDNFDFPAVGDLNAETWFGIMRLGSILLTLAATEIVRRRFDATKRESPARLLQVIYTTMVASVLLLAWTDHIILAILAFWAFGTMRRTASPVNEAWINQHIDSKVRATVLSMTGQVDAVGQMAGRPIVGAIGTLFSLRGALFSSAIILSPVVPLYGRTKERSQPGIDPSRPPASVI
jgi:DHA3 family tetracycline resistance protein-like MFS transporter